jgi:glycosyltransferase involved in cell wall biosynthesis
MRDEPLVSIIINNYNYGRFLGEAIDSALNQDYPDTEVIVVDDGSTDNSRSVISGFGDRVVPVLKENGGQASACNAGFAVSKGDIIFFLDSDDVLLPDAASRVVEAFRERPDAVKVQFRLRHIDVDGSPTSFITPRRHWPYEDGVLEYILRFDSYPVPPTSGNTFAAAALRLIMPIPREDLYRAGVDYYLNNMSVLLGPVVALEEVHGLYRVHHGSLHQVARSTAGAMKYFGDDVRRLADVRARQKQLFETLHRREVRGEVGRWDLFFLRDRMVHLKLAPESHPFDESPLRLCFRGWVASAVFPKATWRKRAAYLLWFPAMAAAPRSVARVLAQPFFSPYDTGRPLRKALSYLRTTLVPGRRLADHGQVAGPARGRDPTVRR